MYGNERAIQDSTDSSILDLAETFSPQEARDLQKVPKMYTVKVLQKNISPCNWATRISFDKICCGTSGQIRIDIYSKLIPPRHTITPSESYSQQLTCETNICAVLEES